jgi:hypothetical protein
MTIVLTCALPKCYLITTVLQIALAYMALPVLLAAPLCLPLALRNIKTWLEPAEPSLNNTYKLFTTPAQSSSTTMTISQYLQQALTCLQTIMHIIMLVRRCIHALYASSHRVQLRRHSSEKNEASPTTYQALAPDHLHEMLHHVLLLLLHQQQPHHLTTPATSPLTMDRLPTQLTG